jgi:hypothetical protein
MIITVAEHGDLAEDILAGTILRTFCLGAPFSATLLQALSFGALNKMLEGYDVHGGKALLDAKTTDAAMNAGSLARIEKTAGRQAASQLEEIATVTAATFRDLFRENPSLREPLESMDYALDLQHRGGDAVVEAAKLASKEVLLKDAQTYLEVCGLVANLAARKASDLIARRSEGLPPRHTGIVYSLRQLLKKILG